MLNNSPASTSVATSQSYTRKGNFSSNKNNTNGKLGNAIQLSMNCASFLGVNTMIYNNVLDTSYSAAYNSVPTRGMYCVVNWQTLDQANSVANLEFRIDLEQTISFYENDVGANSQLS